MDPGFVRGHSFLALQLMLAGEHEAAVRAAQVAHDASPNYPMMAMPLAIVLHCAGRIAEAREMKARAIGGGIPPVYRAMIHAWFGETDEALTALEHGYVERADWMHTLPVQSHFRALREHPRFLAVVDRVRRGGPG